MRQIFLGFLLATGLCAPVFAGCEGNNLIAAMPVAEQDALRQRADQAPYAIGNYWLATRGDAKIHLIGTYHFADPRHSAIMARLAPDLAEAKTVLVEAGPAEQESLKQRISDDPSLIINTKGPTLPEVMAPEDWTRLSKAVSARGIPAFMAAKFQPWYVSMLLAIPVCGMTEAAEQDGLDSQIIQSAQAQAIPVEALEPYDTIFGIFGHMSQADQIDMLTAALAVEGASADTITTLADSYFAEEGRLIWEFNRAQSLQLPGYTPERVDEEFAKLEQSMMIDRNRAWLPVLESAAQKGPVFAGFGALHLSGEDGVLRLLEKAGYTITRLPLP